eukprot:768677-Hanusia_phi.AAC.9
MESDFRPRSSPASPKSVWSTRRPVLDRRTVMRRGRAVDDDDDWGQRLVGPLGLVPPSPSMLNSLPLGIQEIRQL